jgi:hypothetical protein
MLKNADLQRLLESDGGGDGDGEATTEVPSRGEVQVYN